MQYYVIAEPELVTAFNLIGIRGSAVANAEEALYVFRRLTRSWHEELGAVIPGGMGHRDTDIPSDIGDCRMLIMTEELADSLGEELEAWQMSGEYPIVVEIPGLMGRVSGRKTLVDVIREAIGVQV